MSESGSELVRRQTATARTMARYRARPFDWRKSITCVHMARFHLRAMGHRPEPLPARVRSAIGARRALDERGWKNVAEMLDALPGLQRIAPAMMLLGDIVVAASDGDDLGSIMICAGPQKLIGWHGAAEGMVVIDVPLDQLDGAWRV
ncbi:DUF6950 family protein [Novosphingobium album (ex Liu et al. 2023)]|uniref:DUF6950 domain-containing protein n=1 Tax=Novosphingobium album (ex Liu et al. 2023) TaxID=3031130 RepID=A0ABT5WYF5_9SPHN|nr:hypothetical protein [Novosphingobium album (ex Liu et al. 2023)]MDE8654773.1 hypothetical protein [Novosphingobium album (ex Liu et al. 2023)]